MFYIYIIIRDVWKYQGGRFPLSLELPLIYRAEDSSLSFVLHHHNFRRDIRTLLFGDSQTDLAKNILLSKAVQTFIRNSRRLTEGTYM